MNKQLPPPLFDWTLMRSFIAVIDEGSLQAAALKLHSSQPTIGRHIAALEQQLGNQLFDRRARQLIPTTAALNIAVHARSMEANAYAIDRALRGHSEQDLSHVRISASQCTACYLLPPILQQLRQQQPLLAIEIVASNHVVNLQRREADIAIRMSRPKEENVIARRLGQVGLGTYAHQDYLNHRGTPTSPLDLRHHDLIGYDNQKSILNGFERLGIAIDREHFNIRTDDHMMAWKAISNGLGIGFTAHYVATRDANVINLLPEMAIAPLEVWITLHEDLRSNTRIRRIFDFLSETLIVRLNADDNILPTND